MRLIQKSAKHHEEEKEKLIGLFISNLGGGGAERSMVILANGLAEKGHRVHLILATRKGVYFEEVSPKVTIVDMGAKRTLTAFFPLVRYLRQQRPYAIVSALDHANLIAIWAKYLSKVNVKIIVSVRSVVSLLYKNDPILKYRTMPFLVRLFYPYADWVVAVSNDVAQDLIKNYNCDPSKARVIYNPVIGDEIYTKAQAPVEHPWLVLKEHPVILGVGRLEPQKDFETLIRAFQVVIERIPSARLLILGEGGERKKLERLCADLGLMGKVDLPGFITNPFPYMKQADVFVLSSRFEGLPGVLIQAMALGTPVVATDCPGGVREILEDGKWGALVPVGDVKKMAKAVIQGIQRKLPDPSPRGRVFTVDASVNQYLEILGLTEDGWHDNKAE